MPLASYPYARRRLLHGHKAICRVPRRCLRCGKGYFAAHPKEHFCPCCRCIIRLSKHHWLQVHLSTAVLIMLAAGWLLKMNMPAEIMITRNEGTSFLCYCPAGPHGGETTYCCSTYAVAGWPFPFSDVQVSEKRWNVPDPRYKSTHAANEVRMTEPERLSREFGLLRLSLDILLWLFGVGLIVSLSEWRIRRAILSEAVLQTLNAES